MTTNKILTCLLSVGALLFCRQAVSQIPNETLYRLENISVTDSNTIGFSINYTGYMRNTEYFNRIEVGRTLFGYHVTPAFCFQPFPGIRITAGAWLRNDFGGKVPYTNVLPVFSLKAVSGRQMILFGSIEGGMSHQLAEPLYDIDRAIISPVENGFQYKFSSKQFWLDTWVNWEHFIEPGDKDKERINGGLSSKFVLPVSSSGSIAMRGQAVVLHQGGQIDSDTSLRTFVALNTYLGLMYSHSINSNNRIDAGGGMFSYSDQTGNFMPGVKSGSGLMANLSWLNKSTTWMVNYWQGTNYISPRGTTIYRSNSIAEPGYYEKSRKLLFFRVIHNKQLWHSPIQASVRFEPVYDLNNRIFDYSYSLYLVYRGDFRFRRHGG